MGPPPPHTHSLTTPPRNAKTHKRGENKSKGSYREVEKRRPGSLHTQERKISLIGGNRRFLCLASCRLQRAHGCHGAHLLFVRSPPTSHPHLSMYTYTYTRGLAGAHARTCTRNKTTGNPIRSRVPGVLGEFLLFRAGGRCCVSARLGSARRVSPSRPPSSLDALRSLCLPYDPSTPPPPPPPPPSLPPPLFLYRLGCVFTKSPPVFPVTELVEETPPDPPPQDPPCRCAQTDEIRTPPWLVSAPLPWQFHFRQSGGSLMLVTRVSP